MKPAVHLARERNEEKRWVAPLVVLRVAVALMSLACSQEYGGDQDDPPALAQVLNDPTLQGGIGEKSYTSQGFRLRLVSRDKDLPQATASQLFFSFFSTISREAALFNPNCARDVTVEIHPSSPCGVGFPGCTTGATIKLDGAHLRKNPADIDLLTHENMHVVSPRATQSCIHWDEGLADYARDKFGLNNVGAGWRLENPRAGQNYTASYKVTAKFLKWIASTYGEVTLVALARSLREGTCPPPAFWTSYTRQDVDALWNAYLRTL